MWLKCIDRGHLNHTLAGLNLWLSDWRIRACRVSPGFRVAVKSNVFLSFHTDILTLLCIHFFCTLFLLNFLNFPLVDTLVLLTGLRICYPIKVNYCLSSIFSFCLWGSSFFQSHLHTSTLYPFCMWKTRNLPTARAHRADTVTVRWINTDIQTSTTELALRMPVFPPFAPHGPMESGESQSHPEQSGIFST